MKRKMVQVEEVWMSGEELAEALDISPARVSQLAAQGVFEQRTEDGYELNFSLRNYERYILAPRLYD
jgi:biotin operon repressor